MVRVETLVIGAGLLIMAMLIIVFTSLTDGVNQDPKAVAERNAARVQASLEAQAAASPPADTLAPTVAPDALVVVGSTSILTDAARTYLRLDFGKCEPGQGDLQLKDISMTFEMKGLDGDNCLLEYGDGDVATATCRVPSILGAKQFDTHEKGVYLDKISKFCSDLEPAPS